MSNLIAVNSTEHEVHSVCVYQANRAEVRRIVPVQLKAGQNEVCIEKLPNCIDKDSIRVEGLGNAVIFDVIHSPPAPVNPDKTKSPKHRELREVERRIENLEAQKQTLEEQRQVLEDYSKTLTAEKVDAGKLAEFLTIYKESRARIHEELVQVKDQLEEANEEAKEKRKGLYQDDAGLKRGVKVTVIVLADEDGKAELSVWYVVSGASWEPLYDLRATVAKSSKDTSSISLQYRASISQSTGEDWNDVDLTLSTASPQQGTSIPTLLPYKIGPVVPLPPPIPVFRPMVGSFRASRKMSAAPMAPGAMVAMDSDYDRLGGAEYVTMSAPPPPPPMAQLVAAAVEGATSSTFAIAGRSSIPSDGDDGPQTHKVSIALIDLDASLEWITVPKLQSSVFLRCLVKNTSQYVLLPGPSSVFMDNNFVCKSSLPHVSPQESFSTSLGVDSAIRVTYHNQQKKSKSGSSGILSTNKNDVSSFTQRITIKNTRSAAASPVFVKDQVPVSEDNDIKVVVTEPRELGVPSDRKEVAAASGVKARWAFHDDNEREAGASSWEKTGGVEEEGVVEWVCEIEAGKSLDLSLSWDVSAPAGKAWVKR